MKFIHTADWHLGKLLKEHAMTEDQAWLLEHRFLPLVDEEKPDVILLAGDVYDRSFPPEEAVELFDRMTEEIVGKRHIPFIVISGNHDSAERLAVASRLLRRQGLYIFGPLDKVKPVILEDAWGKVAFLPLPYTEPARVRVLLHTRNREGAREALIKSPSEFLTSPMVQDEEESPANTEVFKGESDEVLRHWARNSDEKRFNQCFPKDIHSFEDAERKLVEVVMSELTEEERNLRKVAIAHAFAAKGEGSASERPLSIGGYDQISDAVFSDFCYTALGHLHRPQRTQKDSEAIQYSGSLMRYSFDEVKQKKGVIVGEIDADGAVHTTFHDMIPKYQVRTVEGTFEDLMQAEGSEDYLQITLTDERPIIDAMPKLREKYPNALGVVQDMGFKEDSGERVAIDAMSDQDIFRAFVKEFRQRELSEEEEIYVNSLWDEVYKKENVK